MKMNIQQSTNTDEKETIFTRPELLSHPNIPKPLHGLAPRTLVKAKVWDTWRRMAYAKNNFHCFACGVYRNYDLFSLRFDDESYESLDAHEVYRINYDLKTVELVEIVALCKNCHNYIHSGRLQSQYDEGRLDEEDMYIISNHGDSVLIDGGLAPCFYHDENDYKEEWGEWKLIFNGEEYFSKFKDYFDWFKKYQIK